MRVSAYGLWKKMVGNRYNLCDSHFPVTVLAVTEDESTRGVVIAYKPIIHDGMFSCTYEKFVERFVEMPPSDRQIFLDHLEVCTFCRSEPKDSGLDGLWLLCEAGAGRLKAFADSITSRPATAEDILALARGGKP